MLPHKLGMYTPEAGSSSRLVRARGCGGALALPQPRRGQVRLLRKHPTELKSCASIRPSSPHVREHPAVALLKLSFCASTPATAVAELC
mmetsp:Transcript_25751/g.76221  ORF Transcript_25751/g.76221 Transcript_25751/m.76221 type:complete len:89 (-) Transcript_25751:366-632(-)